MNRLNKTESSDSKDSMQTLSVMMYIYLHHNHPYGSEELWGFK